MNTLKLSIVIPVFNAEKTLNLLIENIKNVIQGFDYEVILVNDHSNDRSGIICKEIVKSYSNIKYIALRKNYGEHNAVMCGLNYAEGKYSVIIDDDFQNPPSEILKLLEEAEKGFDVVYSKYKHKHHSIYRNFLSLCNNILADSILSKPKHLYLSSFKIIRKELKDELIKYKGPFPYIDGLIMRTTNSISSVLVEHHDRLAGKSNYNLKKLVSLNLNMILNFSVKPLRIFTIIGFIIFIIGVLTSIIFIIEYFIYKEPAGWTSLIIAILTLSGFQLLFLGLIGEYLGKQYLDQNQTPQWVVRKYLESEKPNKTE